jgi:hypothetical protein
MVGTSTTLCALKQFQTESLYIRVTLHLNHEIALHIDRFFTTIKASQSLMFTHQGSLAVSKVEITVQTRASSGVEELVILT